MPIGLITSVLLARWLLAEQLGMYALTVTVAAFSVPLLHLGLPSATVFRIRSGAASPGAVATAALIGTAAISLVAVGIGIALGDLFRESFFGDSDAPGFGYAIGMIPVDLFGMALVAVARGVDRFDIANRYRILVTCVTLFFVGSLCTLGFAALEMFLGATLVARLIATVFAASELASVVALERFARGELAAQLRFGLRTYWQTVADRVHEQIDLFMLGAILGPSPEVGIYAVAVSIVDRLRVIPDAIASALFPHLSGLGAASAGPIAARATRHSLAGVVATCIAIALFAPPLLPLLYGAPFEPALTPLLLLIPAMAFLTLYLVLARYFMAIARQEISSVTQSISIALNLCVNAVLIPRWGAIGAAVASLASYTFEGIVSLWVFSRVSRQPALSAVLLTSSDLLALKQRGQNLLRRIRAS